jgi:hypothetical protein
MRSLAAAVALGSFLGSSCYSEPLPPSTYRYACDADDDCNADEICRRGLCERPCTQLEVAAGAATDDDPSDDPCPLESGYATCFNGACASTCAVGSSFCPSGQECIDLGLDLGGGGGLFGGGSDEEIGICGIMCEPGDDICPEGEVCIIGFCAIDCSQGQACPDANSCVSGVCVPDGFLPTDDGSGSTAGDGSSGAATDGSGSADGTTDPTGTGTGMGADPADEERR